MALVVTVNNSKVEKNVRSQQSGKHEEVHYERKDDLKSIVCNHEEVFNIYGNTKRPFFMTHSEEKNHIYRRCNSSIGIDLAFFYLKGFNWNAS